MNDATTDHGWVDLLWFMPSTALIKYILSTTMKHTVYGGLGMVWLDDGVSTCDHNRAPIFVEINFYEPQAPSTENKTIRNCWLINAWLSEFDRY